MTFLRRKAWQVLTLIVSQVTAILSSHRWYYYLLIDQSQHHMLDIITIAIFLAEFLIASHAFKRNDWTSRRPQWGRELLLLRNSSFSCQTVLDNLQCVKAIASRYKQWLSNRVFFREFPFDAEMFLNKVWWKFGSHLSPGVRRGRPQRPGGWGESRST